MAFEEKSELKNKNVNIRLTPQEREIIEIKASLAEVKLSTYIRRCVKYCLDNDIDLSKQ